MIRILKEFTALLLVLAVGGAVVIGLQRTVATSSPSTYDTFQAKVNAIPVVILTPSGGQILTLPAPEGAEVNVGQTLATIQVFDRNYRPPADSQVLKLQGDKLQIVSPVTGVVGRLSVAPLSLVGGNQTLMDLYAPEDTDLHVMVPQGDSLTTYRAFYAATNFFVARPADSVSTINRALREGKNLLLTPGTYQLDRAIEVTRANTVVLGLGFPTLIPENGNVSMTARASGVLLSGMIFDAGAKRSPVLLQVGSGREGADEDASGPSALHDVFFRIGGAAAGKARTSLVVNSDNVILDDIWAWRADHGNGVGWTSNTADTGVVVNGDNVTAYGLFVEHYQKFNVIWNGNRGTDIFFQNEMPYDPPSQAAWMEAPGVDGWAAFKVGREVESFAGYGMGSYSFFNHGVNIYAAHAFEVPDSLPAGSLHDLLTIFLDPSHGKGGILHVVNAAGGSSTIANPDAPVTVVSYP